MFSLFGRNKGRSGLRPPRAPGDTIRPDDAAYLQQWIVGRTGVEGFVEPETVLNEMSIVLVDAHGEFTRRPIGGPKGIDAVAKLLRVSLYDVEETGYPQRMRNRIERDRRLRKRAEQRLRRAEFDARKAAEEGEAGES